jgi:arylsulfatase
MTRIPEGASPDIKNKSWSLTAEVEVPQGKADGILATQGGLFGGWALYLADGKPTFHYNLVNVQHYAVTASQPLAPGKHTIVMDFKYEGGGIGKGGTATLSVDGAQVAQGRIDRTIPIRIALDEGLDIGEDTGTPVNLTYDVPFRFTGKLGKVTIDLKGSDTATADTAQKVGQEFALKKAMQD